MFGTNEDVLDDEDLLKNEDFFEEPVSPGELPTLREDTKIIATLESNLKSIQYLLEDITTTGGMSQALALEAANYSAAIKDKPIHYFTKDPTATQLEFSIESLVDSIRAGFKLLIETIKKWIKKVVAWFVGLGQDKKEITDREYEKAKQEVDIQKQGNTRAWEAILSQLQFVIETNKVLEENNSFVTEVIPNIKEDPLHRAAWEVMLVNPEGPVNNTLKQIDPFIHDFVFLGPYTVLICEIASGMQNACLQLDLKLKQLEDAFSLEFNDPHGVSSRIDAAKNLKASSEPVYLQVDHKAYDLGQITSLINRTRDSVAAKSYSEPVGYAELAVRLFNNDHQINIKQLQGQVFDTVKRLIEIETKLNKLSIKDSNIDYGDFWVKGNQQLVSDLRTSMSAVALYVNQLGIILRYVKSTTDFLFFVNRDIVHHTDNMLDWLITEGKKQGLNVPSAIASQVQEMNNRRNKNYTLYRQYRAGKKSQ